MSRKNKGYQREHRDKPFDSKKLYNSFPKGINKSLEEFIKDIKNIEEKEIKRIKNAYKEYYITGNIPQILKGYEILVNDKLYLMPEEKAITSCKNSLRNFYNIYKYQKRITHKDNQKFTYNSSKKFNGEGWWYSGKVRIPSLKRSRATWKRFYELFPYLEEASHDPKTRNEYKLKEL